MPPSNHHSSQIEKEKRDLLAGKVIVPWELPPCSLNFIDFSRFWGISSSSSSSESTTGMTASGSKGRPKSADPLHSTPPTSPSLKHNGYLKSEPHGDLSARPKTPNDVDIHPEKGFSECVGNQAVPSNAAMQMNNRTPRHA